MPPQHFGQGFNQMMQASFGMEVFYSFVIILCGILIYFGTKELYQLSSHKGIKYFRLAFLFFAISYFFRSIIKFSLLFLDPKQLMNNFPILFGPLPKLIFIYFSSIAVFYLLYSVLWKKLETKNLLPFFHALAILLALATNLFNDSLFYLIINLILLVFVAIVFLVSHKDSKKKKKKSWFYLIYLLLFVFWGLNILDILVQTFLQTFQLLIYLASTAIFLFILYRVLRRTGV